MTIGIYKLTSPTGKIYIGQSTNIERRWVEHGRNRSKSMPKLYASVRKYGLNAFHKEIIEECLDSELCDREKFYILKHDSFLNGLNSTTGGEKGFTRSDISKEKIRQSLLGKYYGRQNIEFSINGIPFRTIKEASDYLDIPDKTIHNRLNSPNAKYEGYVYNNPKLVPARKLLISGHRRRITINGTEFDSLNEASMATGIPIPSLSRWAKRSNGKIVTTRI